MMQQIPYPPRSEWPELAKRPVTGSGELDKKVSKILRRVKKKGDKAIRKYSRKFDGADPGRLQVSTDEINQAGEQLSVALQQAILAAKTNITRFHEAQQEPARMMETQPGVRCWRQSSAIEKVGLYIPGGSAPLFSTVLMLAVPAQLAGCSEIVLCSPPGTGGNIHPAILYAADCCGVTKIFKAGGVPAIAAMTWGTKTIPAVQKIFGPGNQYVTAAKKMVQAEGMSIDMPAGPSELLVIADESSDPRFVAADLLSQAEHGPDSQVILVTTSLLLAEKVQRAIAVQLESLPRKEMAAKALRHSKIISFQDREDAIAFSNFYAPEHLMIACAGAEALSQKVTSAGSVFIGPYSPESAGDYASGTNHTLPTNGYAAMYSGVSLDSFVKKISFQQLSREGLTGISETIMTMAEAEGLEAHRRAVAVRLNNENGI